MQKNIAPAEKFLKGLLNGTISMIVVLTFLFYKTTALAKIRFGPEFNFSNDAIMSAGAGPEGDIVNNIESEKVVENLIQYYKKNCEKVCKVKIYRNRYGVRSARISFVNENWYFEIETDPMVIEVKTSPMTVDEIASRSQMMNNYIFNPIYSMGLERANNIDEDHKNWAGGHIHIDMESAFGGDLTLFRNFIVDYTNHVELAHTIFCNDSKYAPSIQILEPEQKLAFEKLIQDTDSGKIKTIKAFAKRLEKEVYYTNPLGKFPRKHQALNVSRITSNTISKDQVTIEVRAFRAQQSPEIYRLQTQLLEKRIAFLKRWKKPIPIRWFHPSSFMPEQLPVVEFYRYVKDSELDFEPYKIWVEHYPKYFLEIAIDDYKPAISPSSCEVVLK